MKKRYKKKLPVWAKISLGIVLLIAAFAIGISIFINLKLNEINRVDYSQVVPVVEEKNRETDVAWNTTCDRGYEKYIIDDIKWPTDGDVIKENDTVNILLIGQDRRPGESRRRSDAMIIGTIDKKHNKVKMTSLMRDLYVQIPGHEDNRINAAYAFGGMALLDETIEKNFQIKIDGNIEVDFERFQQVINKIGGVDISINADEATYLTYQGFKGLSEGMVHMDGAIRYVGNSDYERTERQKRVLIKGFNNMKELGLPRILELVDEVFPMLTTDLTNKEMINYATCVAMMNVDDISNHRIPMDGTYVSSRIRGMSVLVPDLEKNRSDLKNIIYGN